MSYEPHPSPLYKTGFHPQRITDICIKIFARFLYLPVCCVLKLWDIHKNLLADIVFGNALSSSCFLNGTGDIVVAF